MYSMHYLILLLSISSLMLSSSFVSALIYLPKWNMSNFYGNNKNISGNNNNNPMPIQAEEIQGNLDASLAKFMILIIFVQDSIVRQHCSAEIIDSFTIITAARCCVIIQEATYISYILHGPDFDLRIDVTKLIRIRYCRANPFYVSSTSAEKTFDVGLAILESPLDLQNNPNIQAIKLEGRFEESSASFFHLTSSLFSSVGKLFVNNDRDKNEKNFRKYLKSKNITRIRKIHKPKRPLEPKPGDIAGDFDNHHFFNFENCPDYLDYREPWTITFKCSMYRCVLIVIPGRIKKYRCFPGEKVIVIEHSLEELIELAKINIKLEEFINDQFWLGALMCRVQTTEVINKNFNENYVLIGSTVKISQETDGSSFDGSGGDGQQQNNKYKSISEAIGSHRQWIDETSEGENRQSSGGMSTTLLVGIVVVAMSILMAGTMMFAYVKWNKRHSSGSSSSGGGTQHKKKSRSSTSVSFDSTAAAGAGGTAGAASDDAQTDVKRKKSKVKSKTSAQGSAVGPVASADKKIKKKKKSKA